jgi:hypothetical protein
MQKFVSIFSLKKRGILGHKMGSNDIPYETLIDDGHLKKMRSRFNPINLAINLFRPFYYFWKPFLLLICIFALLWKDTREGHIYGHFCKEP